MNPRIVVCMKWGSRFGSHYVNRLCSMVHRNATGPMRVVCYTDNADGIDPAVEVYPLLRIALPERLRWTPWRKIALWAPRLPGATGTVLFLDLDVVITGSLDDFFSYEPGKTCLNRDDVGNLAVMRFEIGSAGHLFERMEEEGSAVGALYPDVRSYVASESGLPLAFWPDSWCLSFRRSLVPAWPLNLLLRPRLPLGTRLVAFTGLPQPADALAGRWPAPWYQRVYRHVRSTAWIGEHWR